MYKELQWRFSKVVNCSGVFQIAKNCSGIYPINPSFDVLGYVQEFTFFIILHYKHRNEMFARQTEYSFSSQRKEVIHGVIFQFFPHFSKMI
jgi:hypothetical protein